MGLQGRTRQSLAPTSSNGEPVRGLCRTGETGLALGQGTPGDQDGSVGRDQGGRGHFGNSALGC